MQTAFSSRSYYLLFSMHGISACKTHDADESTTESNGDDGWCEEEAGVIATRASSIKENHTNRY